ncbi:MAG: peptidoglycan DD-metalloendopeptidase family protein [Syntrophomonadales bacterium]
MKHKKVIISIIVGLVCILTYLAVDIISGQKTNAVGVTINNKQLFIAQDKAQVESIVAKVVASEEKRIGNQITLAYQPQYRMVLVPRDEIASQSEITKAIEESLLLQTSAAQIRINGQPTVCVADEATANQILSELKISLSNCNENEKIVKADFTDEVEVEAGIFPVREVMSAADALTLLEIGDTSPIEYTVKQGDSLWMIARNHDTRVANIMALNNLKTEDLKLDQKLLISSSNPLVNVESVIEGKKTEVIPYTTRVSTSKSVTSTQVKQSGQNGEKQVTYVLTKKNGRVTENKVLAEVITRKPVDRIVVTGTRSSYTMTASRGGSHVGGLSWPLTGKLTSYFGTRGGSHTGLDIDGKTGNSIRAAAGGTVTSAGRNGTYGLMVTIDHGSGLKTRYAHCSSILVKTGQEVSRGQVIARVGSTGKSTGSHLHFEVIKNGSYQNPLRYLD